MPGVSVAETDVSSSSKRPCFVAAERGDVRVEACYARTDRSVRLTARRDGAVVGKAILDTARGRVVVGEIEVSEGARRSRVGTTLYEAAVQIGCKAGLEVSSDSMRSPYAEAFWRKQESKARAVCVPGRGQVYDAPTRGRSTEGLPRPGEDAAGDPVWHCARYTVRAPCSVPTLDGMPRTPSRTRARAQARTRAR